MNRNFLSLIILFFSLITVVNAQDEEGRVKVSGVILDAKTNEPVGFANVGLLGTIAGAASDIDGKFELTVPIKYQTYVLKVSAVGYASQEFKLYEIKEKPDMKIMLVPVAYEMGGVYVTAPSLVYKKMLEKAVANIPNNYIMKPYNYTGYFKYDISVNAMPDNSKEAVVTVYDSEGYSRSDVEKTFKELNYRFSQVRRNKEVKSVFDGMNYFDDILTADVVRNPRNVLDMANSRDYSLSNKGRLVYEGDSVQVIGYTVAKPSPSLSGDAAVTKYSGEIYVNLKNFAILKNTVNITSSDFNLLGRNLITVDEPKRSPVQMTIETNYKKVKSVYFLSGVTIQYSYKEGGNDVKGEMQYVTTRVNIDNPEPFAGRMYYEDLKTNQSFWNNYSVYFEE